MARVVRAAVVTAMGRDGLFHAVVAGIHGQNRLWSGTAALAAAGAEPPGDFAAAVLKLRG